MEFGQASEDFRHSAHNLEVTSTMHIVPETVLLEETHIIKQEMINDTEVNVRKLRKRKLPENKSTPVKHTKRRERGSKLGSPDIPEEIFDQKIELEDVLETEMDVKSEDIIDDAHEVEDEAKFDENEEFNEEDYQRDIWDSRKVVSKDNLTREEMLGRKIKTLLQKDRRNKRVIQKLKAPKEEKIKKLVKEYIVKHHSFAWASFILNKKSSIQPDWTEQEVLKAIGLRRISKKAYNYMRDNALCPLPSNTTLRRWAIEHPEWDVPAIAEHARPTATKQLASQKATDKENTDVASSVNANPCGQCGKNFGQKALLNEHLAEFHGDERARKMQCKVCSKWVSNAKIMVGHQNMHMGIKPFKCDFCEKSYRTRNNMAAHRKEMHGEEWKAELGKRISEGRKSSNPCPHCGIQFPLQPALNQHLAEIHNDPEAQELQCKTCDKFFRSKKVLENHERTHTGDRPFKCDFCPKSFLSDNTMSVHRKHMHPEEWEANKDQIYERNKEAMKLKMRESYRDGTRKVGRRGGRKASTPKKEDGENEKVDGRASSNPCSQCGMDFPFQGTLYQHLAEVHEDPNAIEFQCKTCEKWLGSKILLANHSRTHTGERPFKCDFCPKSFTSHKQMGSHRMQVHHEEWEQNKGRIMSRNRALTQAKRYKRTEEYTCGENNGEATILDEETGMIYN